MGDFWLGGNDKFNSHKKDRPFFWAATGKKFEFTYWLENEPNNVRGTEHCVQLYAKNNSYRWNDSDCTILMGFICEFDSSNTDCTDDTDDTDDTNKKSDLQDSQNIIEATVKKLIDQQEQTAKSLSENLQKQINELSDQIKRSTEQISINIAQRLNVNRKLYFFFKIFVNILQKKKLFSF